MKRIFILAFAVCLAVSCSKNPTAKINATIESAPDSSVVLMKLNYNRLVAVDTIKTDAKGSFSQKVELTGSAPYFYYLYCGNKQIAPLVLLAGDKVKVTVPASGEYSVEGSEESNLLKQANDAYGKSFNMISALADEALASGSEAVSKEIGKKISREYLRYRREATKFIMEHPYSITSAVVAFQKYNDNLPVFGENEDLLIFSRVRDSIETVYPNTEYLVALRDAITARENAFQLNARFANIEAAGFPDLAMPDINGKNQVLSSLKGNVIILSFWSVGMDEHKVFNNDLVELYKKYHQKGLEIYQVSLDVDKAVWASTVKSQNLPWINVNDGLGTDSPSVTLYNLDAIPAMFIIDKNGDLAERDIFDVDKLEARIKKYL